ncbi:MAG: hypothetical protein OEZ06_18230 [Myxococcales bacterium]|nr:hypothetical protein [Myxococcales bacterium]
MSPLDRYFHSEYGAARPYLFAKLFLVLLALDTWMLMIGHAGRYGATGFNVAHFAWLDAMLPLPTPGFYVGVLLLTGLLALFVFFTGVRRLPLLLLFAVYTLSWSMSMLDSYQHHYFVSLILLCLAFFPQTRAGELHPRPTSGTEGERAGHVYALIVVALVAVFFVIEKEGRVWRSFFVLCFAVAAASALRRAPRPDAPLLTRGFGFPLLGASVAIVYIYTAIAKMDENWVAGHTIVRISSAPVVFADFVTWAEGQGIGPERFWSLFATFVIPQEILMGVGYLFAVHRDRVGGLFMELLCGVTAVLAVALHVGAEALGLEIGWFSDYMLALACTFLLPLSAVERLASVLTWPARLAEGFFAEWQRESPADPGARVIVALASAAVLFGAARLIDLPGAYWASGVASVAGFFMALASRPAQDPRPALLSLSLAAIAMWAAIAMSPVRWEYYRFTGGDHYRRGELQAALENYVKGERYAPEGESRRDKIERIRRTLGRGD